MVNSSFLHFLRDAFCGREISLQICCLIVLKLGFEVIREYYRPERRDWKLDLRVNEYTELEIFAEENPPKRVNRPEACGLRHLAFCVLWRTLIFS